MVALRRRSQNEIVEEYTRSVPVDLRGLARELGVLIHTDPSLPQSIAGKLVRDSRSPSGFTAHVNASDNPQRQRFTLAHEIAHYVLHRDLLENGVVDDALYRSAALSDEYEREANRYAARLLMPAAALRDALRVDKSYAALARRFDVSFDALRIHLKDLGLNA